MISTTGMIVISLLAFVVGVVAGFNWGAKAAMRYVHKVGTELENRMRRQHPETLQSVKDNLRNLR